MAVRWSSPICLVAMMLGELGCGRIGSEELPEHDAVATEEARDSTRAVDAGLHGPAEAGTGHGGREPFAQESGAAPTPDAAHAGDPSVFEAGSTQEVTGGAQAPTSGDCPSVPPAAGMNTLLDNLEDGDGLILAVDGRRGSWYTINDGSGGEQQPAPDEAFVPVQPGALGSSYAARMSAAGFSRWGAALGVRFNTAGSNTCTYDASGYQGFVFYARGRGLVTISVLTPSTIPVDSGGICESGCFDYHASRVYLSEAWTRHRIAWRDLQQSGWGTPARFNPGAITALEFAFGTGASFEIEVDDLELF